ncbi:MAG: isochorismate synthase [Actinobacteria bacterium]|uniref:isochorismate synthase n=1 Tax=freshwater metagenome TaxID=449393 RepID=A0A6J6EGF2_9ZZZZ|nr:isochorismate synthase [Actinomycetota bacterium]
MSNAAIVEQLAPGLNFQTKEISDPGDLVRLLPKSTPDQKIAVWLRERTGMIAIGETISFEILGQERFSRAHRWWRDVVKNSKVTDDVKVTGTGAFAFASFGFRAQPTPSILIVPRIVIGKTDGKNWITTSDGTDPIEALAQLKKPHLAPTSPGAVEIVGGTLPEARWGEIVAELVAKINHGDIDKVVLARDLVVKTENSIDVRYLIENLANAFPDCWTYYVDGLVGATPEMLLRKRGNGIISRVLAGTITQNKDENNNEILQAKLLASDKDQQEHDYAVQSVSAALAVHCTDLVVPKSPTVLQLANVAHLSTEVTAVVADNAPALVLAGSLHPTAAVCGTPTERARDLIAEVEGMDRGRYAGPVGWIDGNGDGDLGLAIRCAQIDTNSLRLYAGCGVVAGSTPESELAESAAKFKAILNALN